MHIYYPRLAWRWGHVRDAPIERRNGIIANGWAINATTANPVGAFADVVIGMTSLPAGSAAISNNVTFAVAVTNYGPSIATNVIVTDMLPAGVPARAARRGRSRSAGRLFCTEVERRRI